MTVWLRASNSSCGGLSHRSVGSYPGCDNCAVEQDALSTIITASLHPGVYKWVIARVEVDLLRAVYSTGS